LREAYQTNGVSVKSLAEDDSQNASIKS
jgi:hypothetical protein